MEQLLEFLWEHSMDTDIMQAQKTDSRYIEAEAYTHKVQKQIENKGFRDKQFQAIDRRYPPKIIWRLNMDALLIIRASGTVSG